MTADQYDLQYMFVSDRFKLGLCSVKTCQCRTFSTVFVVTQQNWLRPNSTSFDTYHQPTRKQDVKSRQAVTSQPCYLHVGVVAEYSGRPSYTPSPKHSLTSHFIYSLVLATRSFKPPSESSESSLSLPCSLTASIPSPTRDTDILLNAGGSRAKGR